MQTHVINVTPSNNLFAELKRTSSDYTFPVALSEIIDNSIASMVGNEVNVQIEISGNWNETDRKSLRLDNEAKIVIIDDASGIDFTKIGLAISPAALANKKNNSLHEHGMGLKTALRTLGTSEKKDNFGNIQSIIGFKISTTCQNDPNVYVIEEMKFNELIINSHLDKSKFPKGHGTIIEIFNLDKKVFTGRKDYGRRLAFFLGHRYQQLLNGNSHNKKLNLSVKCTDTLGQIIKLDKSNNFMQWDIIPLEAAWSSSHKTERRHLPIGNKQPKNWAADIRFGYNPSEAELQLFSNFEDHYSKYLDKDHPCYIHHQKIDIFLNDILLCQKELNWLAPDKASDVSLKQYGRNQRARLQIFLYNGFHSSFTKNDIQDSTSLIELKNAILDEISHYTHKYDYPSVDSEEKLKNDLRPKLEHIYENVQREVACKGLYIDYTLFNTKKKINEAWEIKLGEAGAKDFVQLLGYLILGDIKHGVLLARSHNDNVQNLAKDVDGKLKKLGISVELLKLELFK